MLRTTTCLLVAALLVATSATAYAQLPGQNSNLGNRLTQVDITNGSLNLKQIRREGRRIFTTPFNKLDGYGEHYDVNDPNHTELGNRPTLQNNGTFLRVNGLDAQTCQECHGVVSNSTIPPTLGIAGVAGAANNAFFMPKNIDVDDSANNGFADFDGRFINPPFLFGAGGIEAVGKEMTSDLQALKLQALANPNTVVSLDTKGVNFGSISHDGTDFDYSLVEGIEHDLVVRPFGRKGEFHTTRGFDRDAMRFHFGMEPEEVVGSASTTTATASSTSSPSVRCRPCTSSATCSRSRDEAATRLGPGPAALQPDRLRGLPQADARHQLEVHDFLVPGRRGRSLPEHLLDGQPPEEADALPEGPRRRRRGLPLRRSEAS